MAEYRDRTRRIENRLRGMTSNEATRRGRQLREDLLKSLSEKFSLTEEQVKRIVAGRRG
jgi:hypothetical protein